MHYKKSSLYWDAGKENKILGRSVTNSLQDLLEWRIYLQSNPTGRTKAIDNNYS